MLQQVSPQSRSITLPASVPQSATRASPAPPREGNRSASAANAAQAAAAAKQARARFELTNDVPSLAETGSGADGVRLQRTDTSATMKFGTLETPRVKHGESTIKFFERVGNVVSGTPKRFEDRIKYRQGDGVSEKLVAAVEAVRNGGHIFVFGIRHDGVLLGAPETPVAHTDLVDKAGYVEKDKKGGLKEYLLGHPALRRGKALRISGEIALKAYEPGEAGFNPADPTRARLVLINKSGRYGREGVRLPEHLMNVNALLEEAGVFVDEVIFRTKQAGKTKDVTLLMRAEASHAGGDASPPLAGLDAV